MWWCLVSEATIDPTKIIKELNAARIRINAAGLRGLLVAGQHVLRVSNAQTPHEEGDLIRSGGVSQDESNGLTAISYDTDYAVRQHEDMSLHHDSGRNAKFLERAMASEAADVLQVVSNAMKGAIK
jgi:hypothetical protein